MERNLSLKKFAAMSYNGDDYDEQYIDMKKKKSSMLMEAYQEMNMMKTTGHQKGKISDLILQRLRKT